MTYAKPEQELKLVISLGANIPSKLGDPLRTIAAIRPQIEESIREWNVVFNYPKIQQENNELQRCTPATKYSGKTILTK